MMTENDLAETSCVATRDARHLLFMAQIEAGLVKTYIRCAEGYLKTLLVDVPDIGKVRGVREELAGLRRVRAHLSEIISTMGRSISREKQRFQRQEGYGD